MSQHALQGIRVLDFGRYIAAPYCCQLLADLGAEVIRIERPGGEPDRQRGPVHRSGQSIYFATINRNKKGITLNIRSDEGFALLKQLIAKSDVLVHNLPIQRAEKLGLGYEAIRAVNPSLVYLSISGFGTTGPYKERTAFDGIVQATSGAMSMTGRPGQPMLSHIPYIDFSTGIFGALAVSSALVERGRTGKGQMLDQSLFGTAVSFIASYGVLAENLLNGVQRRGLGNALVYGVGGSYHTKDGAIVLNCLSNEMWQTLCKTIGREDLLSDPTLNTDVARYRQRIHVDHEIGMWIRGRTTAEAVTALSAAGIPVGPVANPEALLTDPHVQAQGLLTTVDQPGMGSIPVAASPIRSPGEASLPKRHAPPLGASNKDVYGGLLGLSDTEIGALAARGVI
jgi:crotonobetainyl-CoA:carnitine CoA-transferase CaiB-like acyl-CoA transferase